ncbi:hypothetical protein SteCoe_6090 [Stentor coeruleus]|uniref:Myb-like domain-containing protein n=1 Tax=Stentor coeruleus TaxID=5963 RepID=A0A1R2CQX0_9CILI|nr:hypothetical protein SteCoe_6090 [Stentor coeruleus]
MELSSRSPKLWTKQEDKILNEAIKKFGIRKWVLVSEQVSSSLSYIRSPKQCRERWSNFLKKILKKTPFDDDEIRTIYSNQALIGNKWSKIAKKLPGRGENQIKNFFYATVRRNLRRFNKDKPQHERLNYFSERLLDNLEIRNILLSGKNIKSKIMKSILLSPEAKRFIYSLNEDIKTQKGLDCEIENVSKIGNGECSNENTLRDDDNEIKIMENQFEMVYDNMVAQEFFRAQYLMAFSMFNSNESLGGLSGEYGNDSLNFFDGSSYIRYF